jgi:hypothetical protein
MPRFDGRVPMGMGPSTGWGMGFCGRGYIRPGMGFRHGYGRGYFYGGPYPVDKDRERAFIEEEKAILEARLANIKKILEEIEEEDYEKDSSSN